MEFKLLLTALFSVSFPTVSGQLIEGKEIFINFILYSIVSEHLQN